MKKILLMAAAFLLSFFTGRAAAQDAADTGALSLSLHEAMEYAVEHNRTIQNASLSIRQAEADRWASIASMLPQVNGSLDYSNYLGYEMSLGGMASIPMPPYGSLGINAAVAVSAAQIIGARIGTLSIEMADVTRKQTEQDVAEQVKMLYYSALVAGQTVELLKDNLGTMEKLYSLSMKSVEAGVSEKVDADQIQVQVATIKASINSAERSLEMVFNSMRLLLNVGFDREIILTESLEDLIDVEKSLRLLYDDFIIGNNYSYQLASQGLEMARRQKNLAGWTYGPTLSGFYQYTARRYFSNEATMNMTPPNMIGITLSIPIFSSGKNFETLRSAKIEYQKQQNILSDTEMSLRIQHRQLKYNLSSAYEMFETQKKNVEVSQSVLDNISKKYEHGLSSSLDVTNAATTFITAQNSYVQAAMDFVNAQIELEKLLNKNYFE